MKRLQVASLFSLALALPALAQQTDLQGNACVYISGSSVCPMFPTYIGVDVLAKEFDFFSDVTDVSSFDEQAEKYFATGGWQTAKIQDALGCTKGSGGTIQYQRTVMCGNWTSNAGSVSCVSYLQGVDAPKTLPKICGATCSAFADAEKAFTKNTQYCSSSDSSGNRADTLETDLTNCYDTSANSEKVCVTGDQNEAGTCGFGPDKAAACAYCDSTPSAKCCSSVNCATTTSDSSSGSASASSTSGATEKATSGHKSSGISGGAIAGIVVGVIVGLAIIGAILFFLMRRRRSRGSEAHLLSTPQEKLNRSTTPLSVPDNDHDDVFASHKSSPDVTTATLTSNAAAARTGAGAGAGMTGMGHGMGGTGTGMAGTGHGIAGTGHGIAGTGAGMAGTGHGMAGTGAGMAGTGAGMAGVGAAAALARAHHSNAPAGAPVSGAPVAAAAPGPITPGSTATAIHPYSAALDDEITLEPGMKIHVREIFDDGWATGTVSSGGPVAQLGKLGKFPMVCVGP